MLKTLGQEEKKEPLKEEIRPELFWQMKELGNAFYFFIAEALEIEPLFLEYDELTAVGEAYKERGPLNILDVLNTLEELAPQFAGIQVTESVKLTRTRLSKSQGLILQIEDKPVYFLRDATLKTINFLDFYQDFLEPKIDFSLLEEHGKKTVERNQNTNPGLRLSGAVGS